MTIFRIFEIINILMILAALIAVVYLFILVVKALRKYIGSKDVREEKKCAAPLVTCCVPSAHAVK